jgi:hypothetical protein
VGYVSDGDPIGYKVLAKGTPVTYADGVELGTVAQVLDNAREHIFDGIVVRTDTSRVFVDAPEVERIFERRVHLNVDSSTTFEEWRGLRGRLEDRLRRASRRRR